MIEVELFFKIVEADIRERHTSYLEAQKFEPVSLALPVVKELPKGMAWRKLSIFARYKLKKQRKGQLKSFKKALKKQRELRVKDKLLKGYNAGVKMALSVLVRDFKAFDKRVKED